MVNIRCAIRFDRVCKSFADVEVLRGVSFDVARGSVHFVLGPSGAGKSVLVRHVVGLLSPDAGRIELFGQDLSALDEAGFGAVRRKCQLIFQSSLLFEHLSVLDNVAMPLGKRLGLGPAQRRARAAAVLEQVGLAELAGREASSLGAGLQKRVAIARALALQPDVLLYDEPTTGLDPVAARRTDRLIQQTAQRHGITSLVVSHDLTSVISIADRVTFLHEGTVRCTCSPEALWASRDPIIEPFVGSTGCVEPHLRRP